MENNFNITKHDLHFEMSDIKSEIRDLNSKIDLLEDKLTIRVAQLLFAAVFILIMILGDFIAISRHI